MAAVPASDGEASASERDGEAEARRLEGAATATARRGRAAGESAQVSAEIISALKAMKLHGMADEKWHLGALPPEYATQQPWMGRPVQSAPWRACV